MNNTIDLQKVAAIIDGYGCRREALIAIMQDIQAEYKYLSEETLELIAEKLDISIAKVYSVATFYENFSLEPKGKYIIKVCDGTACHVRHSTPVLEALWKELGLSKKKHTTDDMMFTVETVSCLGACGLAPTMMVNEQVYPAMTPEKAVAVIEELRGKG
jgi:NADH-quinone oxidoreductase subunit E